MRGLLFAVAILLLVSSSYAEDCTCTSDVCSCCQFISVKIPVTGQYWNGTACAEVHWDVASLSAKVDLSIDGKEVLSKNVSAGYDFCYGLPVAGSLCLGVHDFYINANKKTLSACLDFEVKTLANWITIWRKVLGCFTLGSPFVRSAQRAAPYSDGPVSAKSACLGDETSCCLFYDKRGNLIHSPRLGACPAFLVDVRSAEKLELCNEQCLDDASSCKTLTCQ